MLNDPEPIIVMAQKQLAEMDPERLDAWEQRMRADPRWARLIKVIEEGPLPWVRADG